MQPGTKASYEEWGQDSESMMVEEGSSKDWAMYVAQGKQAGHAAGGLPVTSAVEQVTWVDRCCQRVPSAD